MKKSCAVYAIFLASIILSLNVCGQNKPAEKVQANVVESKSNPEDKAAQWVVSLNLNDPAKEERVKQVIITHLKAVRDWNNDHPYTLVPEGINPITGKVLNKLERQVVVNSTIPRSVHENLMTGLKKDLTEIQVETILDLYTIGKVAFTMNGYKSIVPNLTPEEEAVILTNLKLAREQAVDYKNMEQISTIFKIYKTKIEDYFNNNGRNWKQMYKAYSDAAKAKKIQTDQ
jgi:hypothetical protein